MIRISFTVLFILAMCDVLAQRFGHFSSEYIVSRMSTYRQAQLEIESLSQAWMDDIKERYLEIGRLESKLEAEKVLLTSEMLKERKNEIDSKLKMAIDYQYKTFGPGGLLFLKKAELVNPELDRIYVAVERVCKKQRLDYLIDKSSELVIVYANPVHDYTEFVLEELGLGDPNDTLK